MCKHATSHKGVYLLKILKLLNSEPLTRCVLGGSFRLQKLFSFSFRQIFTLFV